MDNKEFSKLLEKKIRDFNTNALNEMLKRVQHDKKKYVIPNLFRNLEFGNGNELIALVLVSGLFDHFSHL
jgi:hypothetical protein